MKRFVAILIALVVIGPGEAGHYPVTDSLDRAIASVVSGLSPTARAQQEDLGSPRNLAPVTFLQINDVYSTLPVDGLGGLARLATVKQRLPTNGRTPLLVLAGDFLSPSVSSSVFKGEQMIAALNAAGLDLATLGNHEFDFGPAVLIQRMREAKWQWVVSNVVDANTGNPVGGAAPFVVKTVGPLKIGFIGLCLVTSEISPDRLTGLRLVDPLQAAAQYVPELKRQNADLIVAITHLAFEDDRALVERFPDIDLVIGGHEHYPITATENRTLVSKAGSDAKFVARIDVNRRADRTVERFYELVPITNSLPEEPRTAEVIAAFESRLGVELDQVVGTTRVPLDAESIRLRASETNIGDLVADALRAEAAADVSLVNSGGIRGDRIYPAGPLTRRTIIAIHPFGNVVYKVAITGRVLLQALNSGVSKLPSAAGQFPQVSGLTMRVDARAAPGTRVNDVRVNGQALDLEKTYTVALPDYVLKGGDEYTMFASQRVLITPEAGDLMADALERYIAARREIAPTADGRITIQR